MRIKTSSKILFGSVVIFIHCLDCHPVIIFFLLPPPYRSCCSCKTSTLWWRWWAASVTAPSLVSKTHRATLVQKPTRCGHCHRISISGSFTFTAKHIFICVLCTLMHLHKRVIISKFLSVRTDTFYSYSLAFLSSSQKVECNSWESCRALTVT